MTTNRNTSNFVLLIVALLIIAASLAIVRGVHAMSPAASLYHEVDTVSLNDCMTRNPFQYHNTDLFTCEEMTPVPSSTVKHNNNTQTPEAPSTSTPVPPVVTPVPSTPVPPVIVTTNTPDPTQPPSAETPACKNKNSGKDGTPSECNAGGGQEKQDAKN